MRLDSFPVDFDENFNDANVVKKNCSIKIEDDEPSDDNIESEKK